MKTMREIGRFMMIVMFIGMAISPLYFRRRLSRWLPKRVVQ